MREQFGTFIEEMITNHDFADTLQQITENDEESENSSESSTVSRILFEWYISAQFDPNGYESDEKKASVLEKLHQVKLSLVRNMLSDSHTDMQIILLCIKHLNKGWALTLEMIDYLNKIYKKYE